MVHEDKWHQSLQSDVGLPMDTTNGSRLGLGWPDLGFTDRFHQGSSSKAHTVPKKKKKNLMIPTPICIHHQ